MGTSLLSKERFLLSTVLPRDKATTHPRALYFAALPKLASTEGKIEKCVHVTKRSDVNKLLQ
jgi:flagellar biosynthesis regulator FlbT